MTHPRLRLLGSLQLVSHSSSQWRTVSKRLRPHIHALVHAQAFRSDMAFLCCSGPDLLLSSPFHACSIASKRVAVRATLLRQRDHQSNQVGRTLSTGGGVGESKFRVGCSETQTAVSAETTEESKQTCEVCQGLGFRICDYCQGEKVNVPVKGRATRFHRRCPECRAVGIMMCYRCKVFKCVTFPDWDDGSLVKQKQ